MSSIQNCIQNLVGSHKKFLDYKIHGTYYSPLQRFNQKLSEVICVKNLDSIVYVQTVEERVNDN